MSTPYMNLTLPTPTVTLGPAYAAQNNTAFTAVDAHDHTPGMGVPIPTEGISVNADFPLNSFNLTRVRSTRYNSQSGNLNLGTDLNITYVQFGDLYYVDGAGNQIQITSGGSVNTSGSGNITGMGGTSATASYNSTAAAFTFSSNVNTPANFVTGPISIGLNVANTNFITLAPPDVAPFTSYTLILPPGIPSLGGLLSSDNAGHVVIGAAGAVTAVQIANNTITASQIAAHTITGNEIATNVSLQGVPKAAGKNLVVSNTNATNNLAIVRGTVLANGTIISGEGFSATRVAAGKINISFTTAFSDIPAVSITGADPSSTVVTSVGIPGSQIGASTTGFNSNCRFPGDSSFQDSAITFIAIGQV